MFVLKRLMAAGATAGVLGCAAADTTEPSWQVSGLEDSPISRPAGGSCRTTFEFLPPEAAQPPNVQRIQIALGCNLRHLGLTSGVAIQTITFTGPTTVLITSTTVYTAANGDELHTVLSGTGTLSYPSVTFEGTERYVGGTGRFAGSTGSASLMGSASLASLTGNYQTVGALTF